MSRTECRKCGGSIGEPSRSGMGRPRELCDRCRSRAKIAEPDWDSPLVAAVDREFGRPSVSDPGAWRLVALRLTAAYLGGCADAGGAAALSREFRKQLEIVRGAGSSKGHSDSLDELSARRGLTRSLLRDP